MTCWKDSPIELNDWITDAWGLAGVWGCVFPWKGLTTSSYVTTCRGETNFLELEARSSVSTRGDRVNMGVMSQVWVTIILQERADALVSVRASSEIDGCRPTIDDCGPRLRARGSITSLLRLLSYINDYPFRSYIHLWVPILVTRQYTLLGNESMNDEWHSFQRLTVMRLFWICNSLDSSVLNIVPNMPLNS
jgi:hypothetical protein